MDVVASTCSPATTPTRKRYMYAYTVTKGEAELLSQGRAAKISKLRVVAGGETVAKKGRRSGNKQELLKISKLSGFKPLKFSSARSHARRTEQAQLILYSVLTRDVKR